MGDSRHIQTTQMNIVISESEKCLSFMEKTK